MKAIAVAAISLAASLLFTEAGAQSGYVKDWHPPTRCVTSDAISDGHRRPPTPALVEGREACLAQYGPGQAARTQIGRRPSDTGGELDSIYDELMRIREDNRVFANAGLGGRD